MNLLHLIQILTAMNGSPVMTDSIGPWQRWQLADSCYTEVYRYDSPADRRTDSTLLITTVCAPICSSCARVYNKEGVFLREYASPAGMRFPEAHIDGGTLVWTDNTHFLLDDEEKNGKW